MSDPSWADWIGASANFMTAIAVAVGVCIAWRQLGSWRTEAREKRKAEVAEEMISAANDASAALMFIRNPWGAKPPEQDKDPNSFQFREWLERMDQRRSDFDRLRHAQTLCRAFLGDSDVDEAVNQLFKVRQEVWSALGTLATGTETGGDRELANFYFGLRLKLYGTYSENDALGVS